MNLLYIINKYQEIKNGNIPERPLTFIFGAKAAPAYTTAQDIIHAILVMQELIKNDPEVAPHMNVVMLENYNVALAEKVIPACDISEQISLASKEASGTGNMKFMLNGAVTLGTEDGANVEIHELVGDDNIYIFGKNADEVIKIYQDNSYNPLEYYYGNENIKNAIDFLVSEETLKNGGNYERLLRLQNELKHKDWFKTLLDFEEYKETKDKAFKDYEDRKAWKKKMVKNIASSGYFSSDRTISDYNNDIWKLK
jgi:starch phosphorylase